MSAHARDSSLEYTNPVYGGDGGVGGGELRAAAKVRQRPFPQAVLVAGDHYTWADEVGGSSSVSAPPRKESVAVRLWTTFNAKLRPHTAAAAITTTSTEGGCSIAVPDTADGHGDLEYHNPLFDARQAGESGFFWADELEEARIVAMGDSGASTC